MIRHCAFCVRASSMLRAMYVAVAGPIAPSTLISETFSAAKVGGAVAQASQRTRAVNAVFIRSIRIAARPFASSSSFHRLKLYRQVFHLRLHDFLEITVADFDRVGVRACFEDDVVLLGQMFVHIGRQTIEIPKGRHRSDRAVGEERLEFLFLVE